jgi:hypothetical protein
MISESGKYSLRGSTKSYTNKLQKAQHIFEKYVENPNEVFREVDIFGLIFEMESQTKEGVWYTVSMGSKQCDCADTQSKCKHMLALKKIVDKSYYNVRGVIEEDTFNIHDAIYEEISSNEEEIGVAETLKTVNDDVELYKEVKDLQKSLQSFNIRALSIDQKNFFREQSSKLTKWMVAVEKMIARPRTSFMPRAGSNIETQQRNVTWTRLGFNVSKQTRMHDIGESSITMALSAEVQFPRPDANFASRRRQHMTKKHS